MPGRHFAFSLAVLTSALCACGGGGAGPAIPPSTTPTPVATATPTPQPASGSSSSSIGPSGGTISATVGNKVVTATVPAGAVAGNATFTLTAYNTDTSSKPFVKRGQAFRQGSTLGTFLIGFTIDDGGVPLAKTLTMSINDTGAAQGTGVRLAMYGTKSAAYTDVDTATLNSSGTVSNDDNKAFVGISTASSSNPYAFYTLSSSGPTPAPAALAITVSSLNTQPLPILGSATFTATGGDANGNPLAFVPAMSVDNATVGTLATTSTPPYTATLTTGNVSAMANVVATDSVRSLTGKLRVDVGSQRPTSNGDSYNYTGSWSQTFVRTGQPTMTTNATLADAVTVTSGASFGGGTGLYDFKSVDTATSNLSTTTLTSHEYDGINLAASPITYSAYGLKTDDGFGSTTTLTYAAAQLIDQLPEASGTWSNTGAQTLLENDASGETSSLVYATSGIYTQTTVYPATSGTPTLQNLITENTDGSGSSNFTVGGGPAFSFAIAAPSAGSITITPSFMPPATVTSWYTSPPALYSETDKQLGSASLPSGCTTGTGIPTTANKLERVTNRLDTIIGFTEQQTTDSYVTGGYGVVCVTINDVLSNYYNMQGDVPTSFAWFSQPYLVTTTTQTLALQSGSVVGTQARSAQGLPLIAQGLFQARLMQAQHLQRKALVHNLVRALSKGAVR